MSAPTIDRFERPKRDTQRACALCGATPAGVVWIRFPWPASRADDEKRAICAECVKRTPIEKIIAAPASAPRLPPNPDKIDCPQCGARVKRVGLENHVRAKHEKGPMP